MGFLKMDWLRKIPKHEASGSLLLHENSNAMRPAMTFGKHEIDWQIRHSKENTNLPVHTRAFSASWRRKTLM